MKYKGLLELLLYASIACFLVSPSDVQSLLVVVIPLEIGFLYKVNSS